MKFHATSLEGVFIIEPDLLEDDRGFFARVWCADEFAQNQLNSSFVQSSISYNNRKGTLRGMHYQSEPYQEVKIVRCTQGSIYDVVIDLRESSSTFKQWFGTELNASNHSMIYIPEGCAHGFQTLLDHTEVLYQMTERYHPEASRGVRWNDPAFKVKWILEHDLIINERDSKYPLWED